LECGAGADEPDLPVFEDVTQRAGIDFKHSFGDDHLSNIVQGTGTGCMFFDYDGDGWLDIYLVNGRYRPDINDNSGRKYKGKLSNKLYRNNHDGTFSDVTERAGVGGGESYGVACSAADYQNGGRLDLLVLNYGPPILYHNNGDGTFSDVTKKAGLAGDSRWAVSGLWLDYNHDGLLDLFVAHYLDYDAGKFRSYYPAAGYPGPLSYNGTANALYRNNGDGTFTDVTKEAGVYKPNGRAMSATAADLNNHGLLDIYVANDSMQNYYFRNTGKGTFVEEALPRGIAFGEGGQGVSNMGPTIADIHRNGLLDIFIPNLGYGTLWMNKGKYFVDRTSESGLAVICGQYAGWGSALIDYDNDGYLDVFVATGGAHHEHPEESVLARNDGHGHFIDVSKRSGTFFHQKFVARGVAYGDFENNGKMGLLVMTLNGTPHLLRNVGGAKNHWLTIIPKLPNGKSDAIGARVTVKSGALVQMHDVIPVTGYLSQSDPRPHFGLGKATKADVVEIRWPNGRSTSLRDVRADQFLKVVQEK
jgi:hypothetical protein